ncbi:Microprocessor complex subunit DGCR8 [Frankliniella fusca]|uniref:Microprocessor complex subunit DGCR8 n=1 Tax=Frankliniella fusca TaxID=407009 RepID=A0AAE1GUH0_9NEOP|nr:Microprocessor complex subunit DGCR8 [Frankliniella fusca]
MRLSAPALLPTCPAPLGQPEPGLCLLTAAAAAASRPMTPWAAADPAYRRAEEEDASRRRVAVAGAMDQYRLFHVFMDTDSSKMEGPSGDHNTKISENSDSNNDAITTARASCPHQSSKENKDSKTEEPRLHTEGVSEFLTHYERSGYTEDSLRQFVVLDELGSEKDRKRKRAGEGGEDEGEDEGDEEGDGDDNDSEDDDQEENNDSSDSYYEETDHSDVSDDEIEKMLEEGLSDKYKIKRQKLANGRYAKKLDPGQYENRRKLVLDEICTNHFELLPEGWVQVTHNTGIPIYLHKTTRVCTTAMPYFLGPGSARKHKVPMSAVPCLQYRKALEKEKCAQNYVKSGHVSPVNPKSEEVSNSVEGLEKKVDDERNMQTNTNLNQADESNVKLQDQSLSSVPLPAARIETAKENAEAINLSHVELREYCQRLFRFKTIEVMRFKTWAERRKFAKIKKKERQLQRPSLPDGTKLITFPILEGGDSSSGGRTKKEWIMNPNGKSYVCILHEYVQHALKKQPVYEFKDLENPATPYSATVSINKMKYGTGVGTSKKQAKAEAAKLTLEILIPEMRQKIENDSHKGGRGPGRSQNSDLSFFDDIKIEDPRVHEFCAKTTEPSPYAILLTCLKRNFGLSDIDIKYQVNTLRHQKNEFIMSVGNHSATVICKNKREGKQRASQSILQAMHPHINNWGSLLRLYGSRSIKTPREKKIEEQEITTLQNRAAANQPNWAILDKLKDAMTKLAESRDAVKPIGEFVPPDDIALPTTSSSNLNNIEL